MSPPTWFFTNDVNIANSNWMQGGFLIPGATGMTLIGNGSISGNVSGTPTNLEATYLASAASLGVAIGDLIIVSMNDCRSRLVINTLTARYTQLFSYIPASDGFGQVQFYYIYVDSTELAAINHGDGLGELGGVAPGTINWTCGTAGGIIAARSEYNAYWINGFKGSLPSIATPATGTFNSSQTQTLTESALVGNGLPYFFEMNQGVVLIDSGFNASNPGSTLLDNTAIFAGAYGLVQSGLTIGKLRLGGLAP
jgi:hypothetical protein